MILMRGDAFFTNPVEMILRAVEGMRPLAETDPRMRSALNDLCTYGHGKVIQSEGFDWGVFRSKYQALQNSLQTSVVRVEPLDPTESKRLQAVLRNLALLNAKLG